MSLDAIEIRTHKTRELPGNASPFKRLFCLNKTKMVMLLKLFIKKK